jgi:beta-lactamase class A
MNRRHLLLALAGLPGLAHAQGNQEFQSRLEALAERAKPGTLGITVLDPRSDASWRVNADRLYPMGAVLNAPLAALVLARIDQGELTADRLVVVTRADLRTGWSPLARAFRGERMSFTVADLLTRAVSASDNTAADVLLALAGGPEALTAFLRAHGIEGMRVDLDHRGLARAAEGEGAPVPGESRPARLRRGFEEFLRDPRNTSTPLAAASFLDKLRRGELLQPDSTRELVLLMEGERTPRRLLAGVPEGIRFAHKTGTSRVFERVSGGFNDIGILAWPDGRSVIVAAFLTESPASEREREAIFAELARLVASRFARA